MESSKNRTIADIGRNGLIKEIMKHTTWRSDHVVQGIGDDAAVIKCDPINVSLISSETFVEGVEFNLTFMPFHQIGAKVITAAVSDIYAMNGHPRVVLVNLAVPNRVTMDMIEDLYKGIGMACSDYECQLSGGDVTGSHNALTISVTAYGEVEKNRITYNRGARTEDAICVTGDVGSALAGLKILLREKRHWQESDDPVMQPDLEPWEYVVKRQLVPVARKDVISILQEYKIVPSAMIDITQGLLPDLQRVLNSSQKGGRIYQAALPIDLKTREVADEMKEDVDKYALYGGEDFELLFTAKEKEVELLAKHFQNFSVIGKVTDTGEQLEMQTAEGDMVTFEK